jgi:hypothetical protein
MTSRAPLQPFDAYCCQLVPREFRKTTSPEDIDVTLLESEETRPSHIWPLEYSNMPFSYGTLHIEPAFPDREVPNITYGLPFEELCAHHVENTIHCSRIYIIASKSLSTNTNSLSRLQNALGDTVVGTRVGMSPHTHWNEVLAIAREVHPLSIDCIITLGAGSLTDAAKVICWMLANGVTTTEEMETLLSKNPESKNAKPPTVTHIAIPTSLSGGEYQAIAGVTRAHDTGAKVLVSLSLRRCMMRRESSRQPMYWRFQSTVCNLTIVS